MKVLPESFLKCMSAADRQSIGQMTADEALAKQVAKSEKELQKQIVALLRLKGIEPNVSRMDKCKTDAVGWADITFAIATKKMYFGPSMAGPVTVEYPCAWEIKLHGQLSTAQKQMAVRLQSPPNCWRWREIRSVPQALDELRSMGVT